MSSNLINRCYCDASCGESRPHERGSLGCVHAPVDKELDIETRLTLLTKEIEELRKENAHLITEFLKSVSQKQPKFSPGARLIDELHRCQNGECSCMWLAKEIENYIEEEVDRGINEGIKNYETRNPTSR